MAAIMIQQSLAEKIGAITLACTDLSSLSALRPAYCKQLIPICFPHLCRTTQLWTIAEHRCNCNDSNDWFDSIEGLSEINQLSCVFDLSRPWTFEFLEFRRGLKSEWRPSQQHVIHYKYVHMYLLVQFSPTNWRRQNALTKLQYLYITQTVIYLFC